MSSVVIANSHRDELLRGVGFDLTYIAGEALPLLAKRERAQYALL